MKIINSLLAALLMLTLVQSTIAQNFERYGQPQVANDEQLGYQQPPRPSRVSKLLRVLGVALQYAAPIAANNPRATRAIQWASMAVAVTCEIKDCQSSPHYGYGQVGNYPVAQNIPLGNGVGSYIVAQNNQPSNGVGSYTVAPNNPRSNGVGSYIVAQNNQPSNGVGSYTVAPNNPRSNGVGSYTVAQFPTTSFASGSYPASNTRRYQTASQTSSGSYASPTTQYVTASPETFQQDQPSSSLRSRVQWAVNRLRQLRATIRGIRFRRTGPWRWECEIGFKLPSGPEAICRIKTDGTIQGLP